ncbi:MAG TPA: P-II family nitrogen regulator [Chitinivibrionales bacterium]|jgi:nitrogen regulatory protein P-II 1|nr:P-II family nitrogen regulator [Chitinivibrionales bacterium]
MKLITAIIQPSILSDVKQALFDAGLGKMTVYNVSGSSQVTHFPDIHHANDYEPNLIGKVKLELAVNDESVKQVIDIVAKHAKTGTIGGGKIFVLDIEQCIRIRTGEEGPAAL